MDNKFDELAKGMAQSVTRRHALKKFALGVAGMALAYFGLAGKAEAEKGGSQTYLCCQYTEIQCGGGDCGYAVCVEAKRGCPPPSNPMLVLASQTPMENCLGCTGKKN